MEITQNTQCLNFETFFRSNQDTCLSQRPLINQGHWVGKGQLLADCINSVKGDLALGKNVLVAYMPWEGYNFEDSIVISDRLIADDVYTSIHVLRFKTEVVNNLSTSNSKFNLNFSNDSSSVSQKYLQDNKLARKPSLLGNMFSYSMLRTTGSINKWRSIWCSASLCCVPHRLSSSCLLNLKPNYLATKKTSKQTTVTFGRTALASLHQRTSRSNFGTLFRQRLINSLKSEKHDDNLLFSSNLYVPKIQRYEFYPKFSNLVAINIFRFNYIKRKNVRKLLLLPSVLAYRGTKKLVFILRCASLKAKVEKLDLPRVRLRPTYHWTVRTAQATTSKTGLSEQPTKTKLGVLKNQITKPFAVDGLLQRFCLLTPWLCQVKLLQQKSKSKTTLNSKILTSKTKFGLLSYRSNNLSLPLVLDATFAGPNFHLGDVSSQAYLTQGIAKLAPSSKKEIRLQVASQPTTRKTRLDPTFYASENESKKARRTAPKVSTYLRSYRAPKVNSLFSLSSTRSSLRTALPSVLDARQRPEAQKLDRRLVPQTTASEARPEVSQALVLHPTFSQVNSLEPRLSVKRYFQSTSFAPSSELKLHSWLLGIPRKNLKLCNNLYFTTFQEIYKALGSNKITIQTAVWLRIPYFEDNQFLEEPLEIRLNAMGHFFRSYCQSQRHFSKNIKSKDQIKGISYIRTSAGRIQLNETFYSSWSN